MKMTSKSLNASSFYLAVISMGFIASLIVGGGRRGAHAFASSKSALMMTNTRGKEHVQVNNIWHTSPPRCSSVDGNNSLHVSPRRDVLMGGLSTAFTILAGVGGGIATSPRSAHATYSAYTNREKDWERRQQNGEVVYSNAKDLRAQLREIAPMNSESSKVFCPNGPSAAVSPLMENKCGDRLAAPSVYGRADDVVGNSIPGFSSRAAAGLGDSSSALSASPSIGGFPKYSK